MVPFNSFPGLARVRELAECASDKRTGALWLSAQRAMENARRIREAVERQIAGRKIDRRFPRRYLDAMLNRVLQGVIRGTGADFGNIQLLEPESGRLVIHLHRGFEPPFLEFFNRVECGQAACGRALMTRTRQIIPDVADSEIFLGTPSLEVLLDAKVRAVQSTPLTGSSAQVLGVLSTHYLTPHRPSFRDLNMIDYFAWRAGELIEWHDGCGRAAPGGDETRSPDGQNPAE